MVSLKSIRLERKSCCNLDMINLGVLFSAYIKSDNVFLRWNSFLFRLLNIGVGKFGIN